MRLRHKPNAIADMKKSGLVIFDYEKYKGNWKELFNNDKPIELEIGSGKGDFIVQKAQEDANTNFLALEMNTNAFIVATRKIVDKKLDNVYGIIGKAENLTDIFAENELSKIYLNFSTPWPKKRHHKRRLSYEKFLKQYKFICKDYAEIELKTDNEDFFDASIEYMKEFGMEILQINRSLEEEKSIISEYERKFRDRNMDIFYLKAYFK